MYRRADGQLVQDYTTIELEQVAQATCERPPAMPGTGTGTGSGTETSTGQRAVLKKTIASFDYPASLFEWKTYRVYLEVKVPQSIAVPMQSALDRCMEVAKTSAIAVIAPFLTPATMGGLVGAIPGAIAAATEAFLKCVAAVPEIYSVLNQISVTIKTDPDA